MQNFNQAHSVILKYLELIELQTNNFLRIENVIFTTLGEIQQGGDDFTEYIANCCVEKATNSIKNSGFIIPISKKDLMSKVKSIVCFCSAIVKRIFQIKAGKSKNGSDNASFPIGSVFDKYKKLKHFNNILIK